ncbi:MAG: hypothetical protein DME57_09875 [Verrucomicrobia bacterium]|nr:MAG: hypothetical protein DME57_09875 [Verrucomicrobiota bacterium]
MSQPVAGRNRGGLRLPLKIAAYVAAALATLLWMGIGSFPLVYMFPLGLVAFFDLHLANDGGWGVLIGTWLVYVVHGYFYFRSKATLQTAILFGVLVLMLVGNVAGCQQMIHPH